MIYIICLEHKRALSFIEIIDIYDDERKANFALEEYNKNRPLYAKLILKSRKLKK